jgi:Family of unknown function (DUF6788)
VSLTEIKYVIRRLSLGQLRKLDEWLHELIRIAEEAESAEQSPPRKQPVTEQTLGNKTYRLEGVRCGKEKCKCARGKLHGPYWYSYTRVKGRVISQYVGKRLPKNLDS